MTPDARIFHELWQSSERELRDAEHTIKLRTSERNYHMNIADILADRIKQLTGAGRTDREELDRIIASLKYDGGDVDDLTVGEIRRALP